MEKLFKTIHNLETGEITQVELTAEDLAVRVADELEAKARTAAIEKAAADKATLLTKLGITADEAKLLLS